MYDSHHCALRISYLANDVEQSGMQWDQVKLLDFFVTFPHLLANVRLEQKDSRFKKLLNKIPRPYEDLPNPSRLFFQLNQIQDRAARLLAAAGVIDRNSVPRGVIRIVGDELPGEVRRIGDKLEYRTQSWYEFLTTRLAKYSMNGVGGLKERSGLMEFRHDPS
jgi:hypothetical protein